MADDKTNLPTKAALKKHPRAVVILSASSKKPEEVIREFEWFDKEVQSSYFLELLQDDLKEQLEAAPDYYLVADVSDTTNLVIDSIQVFHRDDKEAKAYCSEWMQKVAADPTLLLHTPKAHKQVKVETEKPKQVKATVKARKATTAAAAAGGNGATTKTRRTTAGAQKAAVAADKPAAATPKTVAAKATTAKPTPAAAKRAAAKAAAAKSETPDPVSALLGLITSPLAGAARRR